MTYTTWLRRCAYAYAKAIRHYAAVGKPLPPQPSLEPPKGIQ